MAWHAAWARANEPLVVHRPRTRTILLAASLVLVVAVVRNGLSQVLPGSWDLVAGIAAAVLAWVVARFVGKAHLKQVGLGNWVAGAAYGLGFAAFVAVVFSAALSLPAVREAMLASAPTQYPRPMWLFAAFVIVPFGTVLFEELLFRGLLWQFIAARSTQVTALWLTSVLFALWHVPAVLVGHGAAGSNLPLPAALAGTLVATFAAGLLFGFLRLRSGSLLAPVLAHVATNSLGFLALLAITY